MYFKIELKKSISNTRYAFFRKAFQIQKYKNTIFFKMYLKYKIQKYNLYFKYVFEILPSPDFNTFHLVIYARNTPIFDCERTLLSLGYYSY